MSKATGGGHSRPRKTAADDDPHKSSARDLASSGSCPSTKAGDSDWGLREREFAARLDRALPRHASDPELAEFVGIVEREYRRSKNAPTGVTGVRNEPAPLVEARPSIAREFRDWFSPNNYGSIDEPDKAGEKDEGLLKEPLAALLTKWGVPEHLHKETAADFERQAKARARAALRPKWDERGKYAELKDLSSPAFLKRVYADVIASDGSIQKETVRTTDRKLMAAVETYVSAREGRRRDMGDAAGLRFVTGPHTCPKRASLG